MKNILFLLLFSLCVVTAYSQVQIPRSSPSVTVADARQKVLLNFYLPRGNTLTINSGLDSSGMIFFYKPDSSIYTRIGQDVGANSWMRLLSIKDTNTILASQAWVINHGTGAVEVVTAGSVENVADLRNVSGGAGSPFSRINGETNTVINLLGWYTKNDGGGGTFYWDDTSSMADNGGTIIDPPGAGTWKRITGSVFNVLWFGAKADGIFDNLAIFNTVTTVAAAAKGSIVYIPGSAASYYYLSNTWLIDKNVKVIGDEWSSNYMATKLLFAANVIGIKIVTYFDGSGANMADLNNLALTGSGSDTTKHGIWTNTRYNFNNIYVGEFGGSGFYVKAAAAPDSGNANIGMAYNTYAFYNGMNGIHILGSDANAGRWGGIVDVRTNRRIGILDESQHGNTFDFIHADANGIRAGQNSVVTHSGNPSYHYVAKYFNVNIEPNVTANWQYFWTERIGVFGFASAWQAGVTYAPSGSIRTAPASITKSIFRGYIEAGQGQVLLGAGARLEATTTVDIANFDVPVSTIEDNSWVFNGNKLYVRDTTTNVPINVFLSSVSGLTTSNHTGMGYKGFPDQKISKFFTAGLNPNLLEALGFTHIGWPVSRFNRNPMDGYEAGYPIIMRTLGFKLYDSVDSYRHLGMAVTRPDSGYGPAVMGAGDIFLHVGQNSNIIGWRKKLNGWDTLYSGSWGAANANNIYNIDGTLAGNRILNGGLLSLKFTNINLWSVDTARQWRLRSYRASDQSQQRLESSAFGTSGLKRILMTSQDSDYYSTIILDHDHITNEIYTMPGPIIKIGTYLDEDDFSIIDYVTGNQFSFTGGVVKYLLNGVEKMRFQITDAVARQGINTSSPRDVLDVQGGRILGGTNINANALDLSSQAAYPAVKQSFTDDNYIETGSAGDSTKTFFKSFNNKSGFYFDFTSNGVDKPVQFKINGTEAFRIDSNRNFIFGNGGEENYTTYKVDINGTVRFRDIPFLATRDTLLTIEPSTGQLKKTLLSFNLDTSRTSTSATIGNTYGNDAIILGATPALAGLMSAEDKRRSDSIKTINQVGNLDELLISPDPLTLNVKSIRVTGSGVTPTITDSTILYTIAASSGITVGTTTITSGTSTRVPFNDGGVYGEDAGMVYNKTTNVFTISDTSRAGAATDNIAMSFNNGGVLYSPSYANAGGTGDRTSTITITATLSTGGTISLWVNGNTADNSVYFNTQAVSGLYVRFDFGAAADKIITEAKFYSGGNAQGTWKWQGSDNGSGWTDIGANFVLGGSGTQTITELSGNMTGYRYYQIIGVSGNSTDAAWVNEFEFKIDDYVTPSIYGLVQSWKTNGGTPANTIINIDGGDVGIGKVPTTKLDVSGSVRFDLGSDATGDIFYRNSSGNFTRLPASTNGKVLTLTSGLPAWETGTDTHIGNTDLTLTGTRSLSGASNSLDIGTNASKLSALAFVSAGAILINGAAQVSSSSSTDANYTALAYTTFTTLIEITANRDFTFPSQGAGKIHFVWNKNSSGNTWNIVGTVVDAAGNAITTLVNDTFYMFISDGTSWIKASAN